MATATYVSWDSRHKLANTITPTALRVAILACCGSYFCDPFEISYARLGSEDSQAVVDCFPGDRFSQVVKAQEQAFVTAPEVRC